MNLRKVNWGSDAVDRVDAVDQVDPADAVDQVDPVNAAGPVDLRWWFCRGARGGLLRRLTGIKFPGTRGLAGGFRRVPVQPEGRLDKRRDHLAR